MKNYSMAGHLNKLCLFLLCLTLIKSDESFQNNIQRPEKQGDSSSALFERLLQLKRNEQKEAVQRIVGIESVEKQHKLLKLVVTKIMEVLTQSRIKLEGSGYLPGSAFPQEEALQDALASMIENTAFMGDLVLYLPDATKLFLQNNEWNTIFKWSLSLCQETVFLSKVTKKMLHLVAQELNLIEREPNYFNPYAEVNRKKADPLPVTTEKKKVKKKLSKGPSLSGARSRNEL